MDLDEWELLPVDGFLDFGDDCSETMKKKKKKKKVEAITVIDLDLEYFRCPSPNQLVPVRIQLDPPINNQMEEMVVKPPPEIEQETVSQVFFKKLDTEFVDMKIMDASPRSAAARAVSPPIESFPVFEDQVSDGSPMKKETAEGGVSLNNIIKWSFTGIGAVCSLGAAAATICILIIGNRHRNKKLSFQIYTDDKRIKKVVKRAAKLNEAISAMSGGGVTLDGGHVSLDGYYDGV